MSERHRRRLRSGAICLWVFILLTTHGRVVDAREGARDAVDPPLVPGWAFTVGDVEGVAVPRVFRPGEPVFFPVGESVVSPADGEYAYRLMSPSGSVMLGRVNISGGRVEWLTESVVSFDQVIPDDLIVQGSLCVGFDCVNNENFGFDTIRLKENNLRIHFEDTSVGSFPTNDWGIEVNASQSGGASYFAVIDRTSGNSVFRTEAGAPNNAMRISNAGKLGLRTDAPVLDIHARTSDTPALRLEQTNAGGWTAQTWDIGANEANFFVRDVTGGSKLPFRVRPGAPTSSLDISASGNVGVGTASPASKLHVVGAARVEGFFNLTTSAEPAPPAAGSVNIYFQTADRLRFQFSDNSMPFRVVPGLTAAGGGAEVKGILAFQDAGAAAPTPPVDSVYIWHTVSDGSLKFRFSNGTTAQLTSAGAWTDASSRVFKSHIRPLETVEASIVLKDLAPVRYFHNSSSDERLGFIAEDVPDLVATQGREGVAPMDIVAVLTKVVQEQQRRIDDLALELEALKRALAQISGGSR